MPYCPTPPNPKKATAGHRHLCWRCHLKAIWQVLQGKPVVFRVYFRGPKLLFDDNIGIWMINNTVDAESLGDKHFLDRSGMHFDNFIKGYIG